MSSPSPSDVPVRAGLDLQRPIPLTWILVGSLVAVHVGTAVWLASHMEVSAFDALVMGRSPMERVFVGGQLAQRVPSQPWRLCTSVVLHVDGLHLVVNGLSLWGMGRLLEPWVGSLRLVGWFAAGGLAGSVASWGLGVSRSDGASGAVFALLGAAIVLAWRHREQLSEDDRRLYGPVLVALLVGNLVLSLVLPFVDASSHVGGLLAGLVLGALPWGWAERWAWGLVTLAFVAAIAVPLLT